MPRPSWSPWIAATCFCGFALAASRATASDFLHVRSGDASIRDLLHSGYDHSPTFRALVDEIESRRGIVYIEQAVKLSRGMDGALLHAVAGSREMPFLRVLLKTNLARDYGLAVLAHELQHVVEVLRAGPPKDAAAIAALFAALDHQTDDSKFETEDARAITSRVLDELQAGGRRR
jgi:hypothetical protein